MTHRHHARLHGLQPRPLAPGRGPRAVGRVGCGTSIGTFRTASLLLYVGIGVVVGEAGISFDSPELTRVLGYSALVLILAEGRLTTSWDDIRGSVAPAALLSTLGV